MVDHVEQSRKASVMVKAALVNLLGVEQCAQWSRYIHSRRAAIGLEAVDTNIFSLVKVVPGLGENRRHVAGSAFGLTVEDNLSALRGRCVVTAWRRFGRRHRKLIKMQCGQFRRDQVL